MGSGDSGADRPVSWLLIERGWSVVGSGGEEIGKVREVIGDKAADIFDGLSVSPSVLAGNRYVPAEKVAEIDAEGRVSLSIDRTELERLDEFERPPEHLRVSSEAAPLGSSLMGTLRRLLSGRR